MTALWGPALDAEINYRRSTINTAAGRRAARPRRSHARRRPAPARTASMTATLPLTATGRR
jgi:hypothetical protein